jgi:hypothetical protein
MMLDQCRMELSLCDQILDRLAFSVIEHRSSSYCGIITIESFEWCASQGRVE